MIFPTAGSRPPASSAAGEGTECRWVHFTLAVLSAMTCWLAAAPGAAEGPQDLAGKIQLRSSWTSPGASPRTSQSVRVRDCTLECTIIELYVASGMEDKYVVTVPLGEMRREQVSYLDNGTTAQVVIRKTEKRGFKTVKTSTRDYGRPGEDGTVGQVVLKVDSIRKAVDLAELIQNLIRECEDWQEGGASPAGYSSASFSAGEADDALQTAAGAGTLEAFAQYLRTYPDRNLDEAAGEIWKILEKQYPPEDYAASVPKLLFPALLKDALRSGHPFVVALSPKSIRPTALRRNPKAAPVAHPPGQWPVAVRFIEVAGRPTRIVDLCLHLKNAGMESSAGKPGAGGPCGGLQSEIEVPAFGNVVSRFDHRGDPAGGQLSMRYQVRDRGQYVQSVACSSTLAAAKP